MTSTLTQAIAVISMIVSLALAISCAATRLVSMRLDVYDQPTGRSSHVDPTPKTGGLAVIGTWVFVLFILFYYSNDKYRVALSVVVALESTLSCRWKGIILSGKCVRKFVDFTLYWWSVWYAA